ncbi:M16 family metallopeptidase [Qipengyuania sediminis]|uniref:M16 family metallopeptidase n=1 Tax=Qipengyuania sediminis TaxID=1532023 RepID=UPI00105A5ABB|nr:M16 family metallopeptidase [Qipengyuania sediminis]
MLKPTGARLAVISLLALALAGCATNLSADAPRAQAAAPALQPTGTTGWGFPIYDIPADPAVRFLTLDNGLKVAILRNETPKNTVAVRFGFDVGYVDEGAEAAGLSHFLEHMAFNGSRNVPEGEMIKLLEREGLAFGADTNASTSFEDTIYKLDLPRNDPKLFDTALMLMRETASELTLDAAAIDRERGIIQSETRTRNTFARRRIKDYIDFIAPGTAFSQRLLTPGTDANIDAFKPDTLAAYYRRFYRPDNAALVVVGDIDPAAAEAAIRQRFADWRKPSDALARDDRGRIDTSRGTEARNFVDPGVPVLVAIDRFAPPAERPETEAEFRRQLLLSLGTGVLNRRFAIIANAPDAPIISGAAGADDFFDIAAQASVTVQGKETETGWRDALRVAENETRRLIEHGVTDAELREQLANFGTSYRTQAEQAATRRSPALAEAILGTVQRRDIFTTPATRYALFQRLQPGITPAAVSEAMAAHFRASAPLIHVSTKTPVAGGSAAILAAYRDASVLAVEPPKAAAAANFGYSDFGLPGTIVSDTTIADLGIRQIRFANNVRLNLKATDFETGRLRYRIRVGSGLLAIPKERAAQAVFLSVLSADAGTGKHSLDELQQILAGRQITYGLGIGEDAFEVGGATTMADFPAQMQVSAAYVSDPGYRPEAFAKWRAVVPTITAQLDSTPAGVAQAKVGRLVANGDPRFGVPDAAALAAVDPAQLRADLADQLANAPVEITVVGAFDATQVIAAVASSFGALPQRQAALADFTASRQVRFATDTAPITLTHGGAADQALVQVYWPARDDRDAQAETTAALLAEVFGLELLEEVRERLGATYSPQAAASLSDTFTGFGTLSTSIVVAPKDADAVFAAVDAITKRLRDAPPTADVLERARRPLLERAAQQQRENGWWLTVAGDSQLEAERLERFRTLEARLRAVTPAMIQAAARAYLRPDRDLQVRIVPRAK